MGISAIPSVAVPQRWLRVLQRPQQLEDPGSLEVADDGVYWTTGACRTLLPFR